MIRYLHANEIDRERWDQCLDQSVNSRVYAYSWYLDVVSPGWEALVKSDYEAIMPLPARRKWFFHVLLQPFFTQQLGVFSKAPLTSNLCEEFLSAIPEKFRFVNIQLNEESEPGKTDFELVLRPNHLLSLQTDYTALYKAYSSQAKRNLKRALEAGLREVNMDTFQVVKFYQEHKSEETIGVKSSDYERLKWLLNEAEKRNKTTCLGVEDSEGNLLASAAFLQHQNRVIFLIGNSNSIGREYGAMTFLMDRIIQKHSGQPMVFDFEGSLIPGIARFFKSFGAQVRTYPQIKRNTLPGIIRLIKK